MLVMRNRALVIIPNWNGADHLAAAIDSILTQSYNNFELVIVDNGSTDGSRKIIESYERQDPRVRSIYREKNYGYTGGVNPGFELAIKDDFAYAAPFNNDAQADKDWLKHLVAFLDGNAEYGIATCTILSADGKTIDSTADQYTIWGIPFPRGRDEPTSGRYNQDTEIFGASGGASMYRVGMLKKIGLLDQDFFAYCEDVDLSFRAQLAGYRVAFVPKSFVRHIQGVTAARLAKRPATDTGPTTFTTRQYMKNLPYILLRDMPLGLMVRVLPRFWLAYSLFFVKSFTEGRGGAALQGLAEHWVHVPKKLLERRRIQATKTVSNDYLWSIFVHDLPPNAHRLKRLRSFWRRFTFRAG